MTRGKAGRGVVVGTCARDWMGATRLLVTREEAGDGDHDCCLDAIVGIALRKAECWPNEGQRVRVTVEVIE